MTRIVCAVLVAGSAMLLGQTPSDKPKPASVEGIVTSIGTAEPIAGVRITMIPESGGFSSNATTNAQGQFTILNLQPGRYRVDATRTLFVRPRRNAASLNLTLAADQRLRDLKIQLVPTGVISGRIYDENRQPVRAVRVEAMQYQYREGFRVLAASGQAQSDDRGEYRIFNLQPDMYYLRISQAVDLFQATLAAIYYPGVMDPQGATRIPVAAGMEVNAIDVPLISMRTVSVGVRLVGTLPLDPAPFPVFFAMRRDRPVPDMLRLQAEASGAGVYRLSPFMPGVYDIFVQLRSPASQQGIVQNGHISVDIATDDVDAGALAVRQGVKLTGRIQSSERMSFTDPTKITITLTSFIGSPAMFGSSTRSAGSAMSEDGSFVIANLSDGHFHVDVSGLPVNVFLGSARYGGRDVTDSGLRIDGDPTSPLELVLSGPQSVATVEGVVRNKDDQPVPFSTVAIIPDPNRRENPRAIRTTVTDQLGLFSVRGLRPGTYGLLAWEDIEPGAQEDPEFLKEFENRAAKVTVDRGSRRSIDVRIIATN